MRIISLIAAAGLCAAIISGCGGTMTAPTPSGFTPASDDNPLDGGVINNDGSEAEWDVQDGELKTVVISGREDGTIEFGDPADGAVVPREISTDGGDSVFTIDRDAGELTRHVQRRRRYGKRQGSRVVGPAQDEFSAIGRYLEIVHGLPVGEALTGVIHRRFHVDVGRVDQVRQRGELGFGQVVFQVLALGECADSDGIAV